MRRAMWLMVVTMLVFTVQAAASAPIEPVVNFVLLVETNQTFYSNGEDVTIEAFALLDNAPVLASLQSATITVTHNNGSVEHRNILPAFQQISPGHFVAKGIADSPGLRRVEIVANHTPLQSSLTVQAFGFDAYLVDAQPLAPSFGVDISFIDLPQNPSVCDEIKVTLSVARYSFVRFLQLMPDGVFRDILIPHWLRPGARWIKFAPGKFLPGDITFKVIAKDEFGNTVEDVLSIHLLGGNC